MQNPIAIIPTPIASCKYRLPYQFNKRQNKFFFNQLPKSSWTYCSHPSLRVCKLLGLGLWLTSPTKPQKKTLSAWPRDTGEDPEHSWQAPRLGTDTLLLLRVPQHPQDHHSERGVQTKEIRERHISFHCSGASLLDVMATNSSQGCGVYRSTRPQQLGRIVRQEKPREGSLAPCSGPSPNLIHAGQPNSSSPKCQETTKTLRQHQELTSYQNPRSHFRDNWPSSQAPSSGQHSLRREEPVPPAI